MELELNQALDNVSTHLSEGVINHLRTLVNAGESKLCFEELCAYLGETDAALSRLQYDQIVRLGKQLNVDSSWWIPLSCD